MYTYETDNIYLAAYLHVSGCTMEKRRKVGRKVYFEFKSDNSIEDLRESYYVGRAQINASQFAQQIQAFKKLVCE